MALDLNTLFLVTIMAAAVSGGLLLLTWLYHRDVPALAFWGCAFLLGAIAAVLINGQGAISDLWSVVVGNAFLALAYGILWGGTRNFAGRPVSLPLMMAGAIVWLAACQFEIIFGDIFVEIILMAAIVSAYTVLNVYELWHVPEPAPATRWPIIALCIVHAVAFALRVPLYESLGPSLAIKDESDHWEALIVIETIFNTFCLCYLLGALARDRIAMTYKRDALIDPLTGISNRRGFIEQAERLLRRANVNGDPVALLLFDIDHFKSINDTYGHYAGDNVLKEFSAIATEAVRPADVFGRLGGEEFGCLLQQPSLRNAIGVAERVRVAIAAAVFRPDEAPLRVTISAGVAVTSGEDLAALMKSADLALYRAKENGRNRVEPSLVPVCARERAIAG